MLSQDVQDSAGFTPEANLEAVSAAVEISSERCSWGCWVSERRNRKNRLCSVKDLAVSRINVKCLPDRGHLGTGGGSTPVENEAFLV